jgi:hypothetical protein
MIGFFLCPEKRVSGSIRRGGLKGEQKPIENDRLFLCPVKRVSGSIREFETHETEGVAKADLRE